MGKIFQSQREEYKFERRGPRNEAIVNGRKYNLGLLQEYQLPTGSKMTANNSKGGTLYICQGSVVTCTAEAIVNAANQGMLGGGGVDGAITSAGGAALDYLRRSVPVIPNSESIRCRTGDAKITQSGFPYNRLKCDFVIHAVGPNYGFMRRSKGLEMKDIDLLLYSSYAQCMKLCKQHGIQSIGFCLISSGIFRGSRSLEDVLKIGVMAIRDHMFPGIEVFLIGYTGQEIRTLSKVSAALLGTPTKSYKSTSQRSSFGSNSFMASLSSWAQKNIGGIGNGKGKGGKK